MNSHLVNKLSKKSRIKNRKQQLCDRINQCKSLEELKGWERTFSYHPILKDDWDYDYCFFLDLIEFKLKRMRDYFWTHEIVENEKQYGDICQKLINILNAGYKTDIVTKEDLKEIYVNPKNIYRFVNHKQIKYLELSGLKQYFLPTLREVKAKTLFWKYLEHKLECLWD